MTDAPDFNLEPSPADPQPVRVFRLDDCTWWAGYTMQQCIDSAVAEEWCDQHSIYNPRECTAEEMRTLTIVDDRECTACEKRTFAAELARRIAAGEQFPQLFAATEG